MKRILTLIAAFLIVLPVFSLEIDPGSMTGEGSWEINGDRLYQTDGDAYRAKLAIAYPQMGSSSYEFTVKYEEGVLEDGHGGFGIHIFADSFLKGRAWGVDGSWLLWLNYDENAEGVNSGLSAQVYKSKNHSSMDLIADYDLNWALDNLNEKGITVEELLRDTVNMKIDVNARTGLVKFYDPFSEGFYYEFTLPIEEPLSGKYVVLRTNGMELSFGR